MKKLLLALLTASVFILYSCKKDDAQPVVVALSELSTTAAKNILITSVTTGGNITADGGAKVTARGVVWSKTTKPTVKLLTNTSDGTGKGEFTSKLTKLTPETKYYVRAYATNSIGTAYGNEVEFTTAEDPNKPELTTTAISLLTDKSATTGGKITADNGNAVIKRGVVWSETADPTLTASKTENGTGIGDFTSNLTGLTANTSYHVRAYATNRAGTSYGTQVIFKTENWAAGDKELTTQAEVVAFGAKKYTSVTGSLKIGSKTIFSDINDLSSLSTITSVGKVLTIRDNVKLTSLAGLEKLTSVESLIIRENTVLTSLAGLVNITSVEEDLLIRGNPKLTSLAGLVNITSLGGDLIIQENTVLTSLAGLVNIISLGGDLSIRKNTLLTDLCGVRPLCMAPGVITTAKYNVSDNGYSPTLAEIKDETKCAKP